MSTEVIEIWMMNLAVVGFAFMGGALLASVLIDCELNAGLICNIIWCCIELAILILGIMSGRWFNIVIHLIILAFTIYMIITWSKE